MLSYFCMWYKVRIQLYCFSCNCPVASALFVERLSVIEFSEHPLKTILPGLSLLLIGLLSVFLLCACSDDCNSAENLESRSMSAILSVLFQGCFG